MFYYDPRSGKTQEVAEHEGVRRRLLEQAGWAPMEAPADDGSAPSVAVAGAGQGVTVRIDDDLVVLAPGEQPAAAPGFRLVEVSTHGSEMQEFIQVPIDASRRKRSK
jgi:hypothetical protein